MVENKFRDNRSFIINVVLNCFCCLACRCVAIALVLESSNMNKPNDQHKCEEKKVLLDNSFLCCCISSFSSAVATRPLVAFLLFSFLLVHFVP